MFSLEPAAEVFTLVPASDAISGARRHGGRVISQTTGNFKYDLVIDITN